MYPYPDKKEPDFPMHIGSNDDCTGLIPAGLTSEQQEENYNELYDFLPKAVMPEQEYRN